MAGRPLGVHPLLLYQEGVKVKADGRSVWTLKLTDFVCAQAGECMWRLSAEKLRAAKQIIRHSFISSVMLDIFIIGITLSLY